MANYNFREFRGKFTYLDFVLVCDHGLYDEFGLANVNVVFYLDPFTL